MWNAPAAKTATDRLTINDQAAATDPAVALAESELAQARVDAASQKERSAISGQQSA